ncbi:MAG: cupin [Pseudomonadota bacterium]
MSALLGGVGLTLLDVYAQAPGPDGINAGCPHIHALTDEAYLGVAGEGAVELHDPVAGFRSIPIRAGTYVEFAAGTLHRSVSTKGLQVVALMGNAGLPERGDARIYFGAEVDADPARYETLRALAEQGLEGALARRDHAATAYAALMALWARDRAAYGRELTRFLTVHRETLTAAAPKMVAAIRAGPLESASRALARLSAPTPTGTRRWEGEAAPVTHGMCGLLRQIAPSEAV